jgi:shikimate dehydrogenase
MPDRYAVIGNPVSHSKSPVIHAAFARATGQDLSYEAILAPLDGFRATIEAFRAAGGKGANVTLPFKLEAFDLATETTVRARAAQAVNTLSFAGDTVRGDNTDGVGLVRDIETNLGIEIAGKHVLVVGAGGAARGVLAPMLERRPAAVTVANRTPDKAVELAARFAHHGPVTGSDYQGLGDCRFDIVVNATSASLAGELPPLPRGVFADGALAYDMMYGSAPTLFLRWANAHGAARLADGLGMLVEQAAESFFVWRAMRPDTAPVIAMLRGGRSGSK